MNLKILLAVAAFASVFAPVRARAASRIEVVGTPVEIKISVEGKVKRYYRVPRDKPLEIRVIGPTTVVGTMRVIFSSGMPETASYRLPVSIDDGKARKHSRDTHRSDKVKLLHAKSDEKAGISNRILVEVPDGPHVLRWGPLAGTDAPEAAVTFLRERQKLALEPKSYAFTARDSAQGKERTCYGLTKKKPLILDVVGPTRLQVVSALDFTSGMRGRQSYTLAATVDGEAATERTWVLKSDKTDESSYDKRPLVVPGVANKSSIRLSKGNHTVRFTFAHSQGDSVCLRLLIPKRHAKENADGADAGSGSAD